MFDLFCNNCTLTNLCGVPLSVKAYFIPTQSGTIVNPHLLAYIFKLRCSLMSFLFPGDLEYSVWAHVSHFGVPTLPKMLISYFPEFINPLMFFDLSTRAFVVLYRVFFVYFTYFLKCRTNCFFSAGTAKHPAREPFFKLI